MTLNRILSSMAVLALAGTLALSGCKQSGNQQQASEQPNQPTANQPAGQPAEALPGVQTAPPAAEQPGAEAANEAPGAYESEQAPTSAPAPVAIPAGARLKVTLNRELGSAISEPGESFPVTIAEDVVADGATVLPRGTRADGVVVESKARGRVKGAAVLAVRLKTLQVNGANFPVSTNTYEKVLAGKGRRSAKFIGGGGGLGALIGGIAGGGKGAAIGAVAGAGAGTAGAAYTGNRQIVLPAGTAMVFRLQRTVRLDQ
jgi:hypothetical protein